MSDTFAFALIGFIALLGFLGQYIFRRTEIPMVVWLILLGILVGPLFHLVNVDSFKEISAFISTLALVIILFEAGLRTDLHRFIKEFPYGVFLAIISFVLSFTFLSILFTIFGFSPDRSIVAASVLGGTSSIVVIPLVSKLKDISGNVRLALSIESVITDILVIVVSLSLFNFFVHQGDISQSIRDLINMFLIGASFGVILGFFFLPLYERVSKIEHSYMFVISLLFFVFAGAEMLGGNGGIAALFFGLILGNSKKISKFFYLKEEISLDAQTKNFFSFVSFIITTYFFVFMGFFFSIDNLSYFVMGLIAALVILIIRYLFVHSTDKLLHFKEFEKNVVSVMISRGLAAGVVGFVLLESNFFDIPIVNVIFATILFSILLPSFLVYWIHKKGGEDAGNAIKSRKS